MIFTKSILAITIDLKAPGGVWKEGCLVQTCKAGTVVKSLAEECLKLIEQQIEDVLDKNKDQNVDVVLEGNSTGKGLFFEASLHYFLFGG